LKHLRYNPLGCRVEHFCAGDISKSRHTGCTVRTSAFNTHWIS